MKYVIEAEYETLKNTEECQTKELICNSVQFSSVTQSCPTLCDSMIRSMPGLPVRHQLPEFTQTHVHRVSDAIQPSHPLSSPSPPTFILSSIRVFSNESALCISWPNYWSFSAGVQPQLIQGIRRRDSLGEGQETTA